VIYELVKTRNSVALTCFGGKCQRVCRRDWNELQNMLGQMLQRLRFQPVWMVTTVPFTFRD